MSDMVDLRCPVTPKRLFARLRTGDAAIGDDNLIEVACHDCKAALRKMGEPVALVLHRFNLLGQCVETTRVP